MAENFIISGDDQYLREREEKKIRDKVLSREEIDLNFSVYGPEEARKAIDELGTSPFLADKRVVVLREAERFTEEALKEVIAYLKKPSKTGVLVVTSGPDFRKKTGYKTISSYAATVSADKLSPYKIKEGIRSLLKKENTDISSEAVDLIFELKGSDPAVIRNELEKLSAFTGGEKIEVSHVEQMVGRSVTETVYKLIDAINRKDSEYLFKVLEDLAAQKKQVPEILGYLAWHIRTIQKIRSLSIKGAGKEEIISSAGKGAYRLLSEAPKYTAAKTRKWIEGIVETDTDVKRGRKEPWLALEMLVLKLSAI
jgi:DNA polymerase III subunit delta